MNDLSCHWNILLSHQLWTVSLPGSEKAFNMKCLLNRDWINAVKYLLSGYELHFSVWSHPHCALGLQKTRESLNSWKRESLISSATPHPRLWIREKEEQQREERRGGNGLHTVWQGAINNIKNATFNTLMPPDWQCTGARNMHVKWTNALRKGIIFMTIDPPTSHTVQWGLLCGPEPGAREQRH